MTAANIPHFPPEKYITSASNHLVVYAIYSLQNDGDEISAEDILSACFTLFPKKFSLRTYPQWPDSALVGRRLHDCEKNGWLTARIDSGFKLTAKGIHLAERVGRELGLAIRAKEKQKRVIKLQVGKLKVKKLRVDKGQVEKLKVAEAVKPDVQRSTFNVPPKAKAPVVETPKPKPTAQAKKRVDEEQVGRLPVEKLKVTEAMKTDVQRSTLNVPPKAKAPVVETPKPKPTAQAEKQVTEEQVGKLQVKKSKVAEAMKPDVQRSTFNVPPKAKAPVVETPKPKPTAQAKKRVDEEQVGKLQVEKSKVAEAGKTDVQRSTLNVPPKAKAPVVETPKPKPTAQAKKRVTEAGKTDVQRSTLNVPPKAKAPVVKAPEPVEKNSAAPKTEPTVHRPPSTVEKKKVAEAAKPDVQRSTPNVPPEAKARAGKFVKMMEGSDAYRLYKKNGAGANIGEFDFRSLLLCTMESSHETLAKNVELFKGYAEIHNRKDLTAFLAFCGEKFAHLLAPEKKIVRSKK